MKLKTDETANPESEARAGIKPVDFNFGVIFGAVVFFFNLSFIFFIKVQPFLINLVFGLVI